MGFKKTQLTFQEMFQVVQDAVDACFETDEQGNDVNFIPECKAVSLQCAFYENFIDDELSEDFDEAFATYMAFDINHYINSTVTYFNSNQWNGIVKAVDEKIEFRKQKMLQKDNDVSKLVTDLLNEQLETTRLQKKAINEAMEMNKKFQKKDIDKIVKVIDHLNKNMKNPIYQKSFVEEIVNIQKANENKVEE